MGRVLEVKSAAASPFNTLDVTTRTAPYIYMTSFLFSLSDYPRT